MTGFVIRHAMNGRVIAAFPHNVKHVSCTHVIGYQPRELLCHKTGVALMKSRMTLNGSFRTTSAHGPFANGRRVNWLFRRSMTLKPWTKAWRTRFTLLDVPDTRCLSFWLVCSAARNPLDTGSSYVTWLCMYIAGFFGQNGEDPAMMDVILIYHWAYG